MPDTTPRLHTAPNDLVANYSPLSWYAMGAFTIAIIFALLLVVLGLSAIVENKPFNESWLFLLPVVGIVLAFAGRRHVRNSEGTRQGEWYANAAWWICVVGALIYGTNQFANSYFIRAEAEKTYLAWTKNLLAANPADPNDPATAAAFYPLTDAGQRALVDASDAAKMRALYGAKFTLFRQNKVLAILARNKGKCEFVSEGLQSWEQRPGELDCTLAGTLKTPEEDYPLIVPMLAKTDKNRVWQIPTPDGYFVEGPGKAPIPRTPYGWWMEHLTGTAISAASAEVQQIQKTVNPEAKDDFFVLLPSEGGPPRTIEDLKYCWQYASAGRVQTTGTILGFAPDRNPFITFAANNTIEVRVPIELRPKDAPNRESGSRARLVFVLDDPTMLNEIIQASAAAPTAARTSTMPGEIAQRKVPWKLLRLESNLKVESAPKEPGGGG